MVGIKEAKLYILHKFYELYPLMKEVEIKVVDKLQGLSYIGTDGTTIYLEKKKLDEIESTQELAFDLLHEYFHIMLLHFERMDKLSEKNKIIWNIATDYFINKNLLDSNFIDNCFLKDEIEKRTINPETLPHILEEFEIPEDEIRKINSFRKAEDLYYFLLKWLKDKSIEELKVLRYKVFDVEEEIQFRDLKEGNSINKEKLEKVKEAVNLIKNQVKLRGSGEGIWSLIIDEFSQSKVNWKLILKRFLTDFVLENSEEKLNKRRYYIVKRALNKKVIFFDKGKMRNMLNCYIVVDSSASISNEDLKQFISEIYQIVKEYPSDIEVIIHDYKIRQIVKLKKRKDIKKLLKVKGRGGTSHKEVIEYLLKNDSKKKKLVIFFSDYGSDFDLINYESLKKRGYYVMLFNESLEMKKPEEILEAY
jgi:predicted metal-dependent peptidase